jgi:hypothetical protein
MRALIAQLQDSVVRLHRRGRRLLLVACSALMAVFAGTTGVAARAGDYPEMAAGIVMLIALAVVSATVWSVLRTARSR